MTVKMPPRARRVHRAARRFLSTSRCGLNYVCVHSWAGCRPAGRFLFSLGRDGGREDRRVLDHGAAACADSKDAQAAVAITVEAAILAARNLPGFTFIPPGEEARVLGALSIDACRPILNFSRRSICGAFVRWRIWRGCRKTALASRLGAARTVAAKLARGTLERPLRPRLPETIYEESAELEYPLKLRDPLLFLIGRFLHDLSARLKAQSLAAPALHLTLNGNRRTYSGSRFPTATSSSC